MCLENLLNFSTFREKVLRKHCGDVEIKLENEYFDGSSFNLFPVKTELVADENEAFGFPETQTSSETKYEQQNNFYKNSLSPFHISQFNVNGIECSAAKLLKPRQSRHSHEFANHKREYLTKKRLADISKPEAEMIACEYCGKVIKRSWLSGHMASHQESSKNLECDNCGKKFRRKIFLQRHLRGHIPRDFREKIYPCDVCGLRYISQDVVYHHKKTKHSEGSTPAVCHCGKTYSSQSNLVLHIKHFHNRKDYEAPCKQCGKVLANASLLKEHVRIYHTAGGQNNYLCTVCGRRFHQKKRLTQHQKHHGDKQFVCSDVGCGKSFVTTSLLRKHQKIVHLKIKDYKCLHVGCDKAYASNQKLKRHEAEKHASIRPKCPIDRCSFRVGRADYMKNHLKKHAELNREELDFYINIVKNMKLA